MIMYRAYCRVLSRSGEERSVGLRSTGSRKERDATCRAQRREAPSLISSWAAAVRDEKRLLAARAGLDEHRTEQGQCNVFKHTQGQGTQRSEGYYYCHRCQDSSEGARAAGAAELLPNSNSESWLGKKGTANTTDQRQATREGAAVRELLGWGRRGERTREGRRAKDCRGREEVSGGGEDADGEVKKASRDVGLGLRCGLPSYGQRNKTPPDPRSYWPSRFAYRILYIVSQLLSGASRRVFIWRLLW